jgi:hypothetical protein
VEAVLDQVVDEVLDEFPEHYSSRNILIAHTVKALERDSEWVEPYVVTSELRVPELSEDSSTKEVIARIREVGRPTALRKDQTFIIPQLLAKGRPADKSDASWREIRIQVDVPVMEDSPNYSH